MKPHLPLEFFRGDKPLVELYVEPAGFALLHSIFQGQICLLPQVFLDFLLLHSSALLPKPPASRALCQAKRAPRAAFPSGCLAAQTKRWVPQPERALGQEDRLQDRL